MTIPEDLSNIEKAFRPSVITSFIGLYLLSVITYPHFAFTRYSDGEITPSNHYSGDMETVEYVNNILSEMELCINIFERNYGLKDKV